ncbi:Hypothetical predicted protein [Mytilus galloprovincialis]|uniref:CCHC-type domain-containing protein n=1 Tax=Mytilus galloprovincialis TaxID=29158 RepID=A0A8B6CDJ5_MYTGA|nr:Hypothetical predicted protein [Mytilus galloprovincialis]
MDSERTFREARRLTPDGQLMFEENVRQFTSKLRIQHRYIDMIFGDIHEHTHMTKPLACTYKQELVKHFKEYEEISRKYDDYLVSQRCDESSRERSSHNLIASSLQQQVSKAIEKLEAMLQTFDMEELNKIKSEQLTEIIQPPDAFREPSNIGDDRKSKCSRGSSHLSRQRAKVEVAKTRAKFAQEEVELMRKQTAIQADMKLLSVKRDIEEAECELTVLNENFDEDCAISEPNKEDVQRRTAEFILKQTDQNANTPKTQNLNVDAPTFKPAVVNQMPTATFTQTDACREFTQFIVKKDLLSRLYSVCPVHGTSHILNECRGFRMKPISERREFLKKNGICFRCCGPKRHLRRDCKEFLKCSVCQSREHPSALHTDIGNIRKNEPPESHEGENESGEVKTACTQICGQVSGTSKSCSKLMLVKVYPKGQPEQSHMMYSLIDDQSNKSLATSNFFYLFSDNGPETEYVLSSCAGKFTTSGRLARDYVIEALDGSCAFDLLTIIECNDILNNRQEKASPNVAIQYPHLVDIAPYIPEINEHAQIDLLIGRDLISVHHVLDQRLQR